MHPFQSNSTNFAFKATNWRFVIVKSKEKRLSWKRWNKFSTHQYMESNIHLITGLYGIKRINQKDFVLELLFRTWDSSERTTTLQRTSPRSPFFSSDSTQLMWRIHPIETQSLSNIADYDSQCSISKPNDIKVEKNEKKRRIGLVNSLTIHHSSGIHNTRIEEQKSTDLLKMMRLVSITTVCTHTGSSIYYYTFRKECRFVLITYQHYLT